MADDGSDLVSNVAITGTEASGADLEKFGDRGAAAFDKVAASAATAASAVEASTGKIGGGAKAIEDLAPDTKVADRVEAISNSVISLAKAATSSVGSLIGLAAKIEAIGAAAVLGVGLIAKFASSTTKSFRDLSNARNDDVRSTQEQGKANVEAIRQANRYDESIHKLQEGLRTGKIQYRDYNTEVVKLNNTFDRNANAQARVAAAQNDAARKNDAVARAQKEEAAYKKLVDLYGGPLTDSLIKLGTTYDQLHKVAVDTFSPVFAKLIDAVGTTIDKNRAAIVKFIDDAAAALNSFITANGPQIENFFKFMIDLARGLGEVIIAFIIPKFLRLQQIAGALAGVINNLFGTNLTAGTLAAGAAVLYLTGTIGTLIKVVTLAWRGVSLLTLLFGGPWVIAIGVLVLALVALGIALSKVDWAKFGKDAQTIVNSVVQFFSSLPGRIGAFFSELWNNAKQLASDAGQAIIAAFQSVLDWFASFPGNLVTIFQFLWDQAKQLAATAAQGVQDAWNGVLSFFQRIPGDIVQLFTDLWEGAKQLAATGAQGVIDAWNAVVAFFQTLPSVVGQFFIDLWEGVKTSTQQAFDAISATVQGWINNVVGYLQPVLDAIEAVKEFFASDGGNLAGGSRGFAGGGHVRGEGTSTSDSILAWLSDNEFVMRARAVGKYGLRFMNMINDGKLDLGEILGHYTGGLIGSMQGNPAPRLAYASGGPVNARANRVLNLSIGGEHFNGLLMPDDVANKMTKFAIGRQTNSAGRKPSWVGGR